MPDTESTTDQMPDSAASEQPSESGATAPTTPPSRRRRSAQRPAGPPEPAFTAADSAPPPVSTPETAPAGDVAAVPLFQPPEPPKRAPRKRAAASGDEQRGGEGEAGADRKDKPAQEQGGQHQQDQSGSNSGSDSGSDAGDGEDGTDTSGSGQRKRRRRGGRGRRKTAGSGDGSGSGGDQSSQSEDGDSGAASDESRGSSGAGEKRAAKAAAGSDAGGGAADSQDTASASTDDSGSGEESGGSGSSRRRRRRRRSSESAGTDEPRTDDPEETVVRVREARKAESQITATKGSTRVEAKRQRRRDGRDSGRRRPTIMSESEFLARRESVERVMVVRQRGSRDDMVTQLAVLEDGMLVEHYVDQGTQRSIIGNIYLGKVQNVLPAMEAAFVDIGRGRNAILYAGEVDWSRHGGKPKRIEEALTSGQSVLVQVTKDPVGHKGARLTSSISLPGRFVVYVPGGTMSGISRKLSDSERGRLRGILKDVVPDEAEVIIRTAAEGAGEEELQRDVARLTAQWEDIDRKAASGSAPSTLYAEPDLTLKIVRDLFNEDFAALVVAGDEAWDTIEPYVSHVAPALTERLQRWDSDEDIFAHYRVDEQIAKALERKVWLPSGGSLVIDRTEAMTVVDVNTGKFTGGGGNLEETVTKNNLEAAEEVARQLRLRDIGGIIVVDFIDMVLESNRDLVLRRLVECLARDRTRHQVAEVTSLGLVQMTRKRIGSGLLETFSKPCDCCGGRGLTTTSEPVPVPQRSGDDRRGRSSGKSRRTSSKKKADPSDAAAPEPDASGGTPAVDTSDTPPDETG